MTDSNQQITVYNNDGSPSYSIDWPWNEETITTLTDLNLNYVVHSKIPLQDLWIVNGSPATRQEFSGSLSVSKLNIVADGIDASVISGIPSSAFIKVNGESVYPNQQGTVELRSSTEKTFTIVLAGLYKSDQVVTITAKSLQTYINEKWTLIKAIRNQKLASAQTSFGIFDTDDTSKANLLGALKTAEVKHSLGQPSDTTYRLADNSFVVLNLEQFQTAATEVSEYISQVYARSWMLEGVLAACTTLEQVQSIDINSGWPGE